MHRRNLLIAAVAAAGALSALPVMAQDARTVVEEYLAAWNAHDAGQAASFFAEDVTYYDASVGEPIVGAEAARIGVIENFLTAAPDALWTMKGAPVVESERVAFEWEFSGTNTGPWADGTAATGKPFAFTGASIFTVLDGKITVQNDYYDALGFYTQLGLM
jgi:steroid delta-isomerase-like uncharacterized protein